MRFYTGRNPGLDATEAWRLMVLTAIANRLAMGANVGTAVINEVVHFPNGRIPEDVGLAVKQYIDYRVHSIGVEPVWLEGLLDDQEREVREAAVSDEG